jgi:methylated-DNA-[protein]-cysteine S-methyltransferase
MSFSSFASPQVSRTMCTSPIGPVGLVDRSGKLARIAIKADPSAFPFEVERTFGSVGRERPEPFDDVRRQLEEYFDGRRLVFKLPLDLEQGTPFQRRVWQALLQIPYGETVSTKDVAQEIGHPSATRAVEAAVAANPLPIVVPSHRVLGSHTEMSRFSAGSEVKAKLLELESRTRARAASLGTMFDSQTRGRFRA